MVVDAEMLRRACEEEKAKEPPASVAELEEKEDAAVVERDDAEADGAIAMAPPREAVLEEK